MTRCSSSQPWLNVRLTWGVSRLQGLGGTTDQLHQNLSGSQVSIVFKISQAKSRCGTTGFKVGNLIMRWLLWPEGEMKRNLGMMNRTKLYSLKGDTSVFNDKKEIGKKTKNG